MAERSEKVRETGGRGRYDLGASTFESLGDQLRLVCEDDSPAGDLVKAIESEVLPRLMLVHREEAVEVEEVLTDSAALVATPEQIDAFVDILVHGSAAAASNVVDDLIAAGVPVEDVLLQFMAPTARRLGELWDADACDFADVTIALCRLHELLRHNSVVGDDVFRGAVDDRPSTLLATACGDQHVFGLLMVAEFFRRNDWRVWSEPGAGIDELARLAAKEPFDLIGLSVALSSEEADLRMEIERLRDASINRDVKIMIGGGLLARDPSVAHKVGADGFSVDAAMAPRLARSLMVKTAGG